MAKITINKEACKGCGLCVSVCPKQILRVSPTTSNNQGYFVVEETFLRHYVPRLRYYGGEIIWRKENL